MAKKYLSTTSLFSCTFGSVPMIAKAGKKRITMDGMQVMTTKDTDFVKSFGVCMSTGQPKPCSPKLTQWVRFVPNQYFKGAAPLTTDSFIMCALGGKVSPQSAGQMTARIGADEIICPLCGKKQSEHPFDLTAPGTNGGSSAILGDNVLDGKTRSGHKFFLIGMYKGGGIEAHHLICSEAMDDKTWEKLCFIFGYDINKKENGVFLPNDIQYACHLQLPLHKSGHTDAFGEGNMKYPKSVKKELAIIKKKYLYKPCDKLKWEQFNKDLDDISKKILKNVSNFSWWITQDGFQYQPGNPIGCSNASVMEDKHKQCSRAKKDHNANANLTKITIKDMKELRQARVAAYQLMPVCECGRHHKEFRGKPTKNILKISE